MTDITQLIASEFEKFFWFPTDDRSSVSSVSCKLFARHIAEVLTKENEKLRQRVAELEQQIDSSLHMLAEWCVDIDMNGTGWDDWDENYKNAAYRPGPLRELLDTAIAKVRRAR